MRRGEAVAEGFVKFPFESQEYPMNGNGGTFVKLVVLNEVPGQEESLAMCCGVFVVDMRQEILVGDDKRPQVDKVLAEGASPKETAKFLKEEQREHDEWLEFHFPFGSDKKNHIQRHVSRTYRASVVLGSTGWSGYSENLGPWIATFEDLTTEGQELYRMMEKLNPGCPIHLLTFLDT